jgi:hypothetical protein
MLSATPTWAQPPFTPTPINKYFVTLVQRSLADCQVQKKREREVTMCGPWKIAEGNSVGDRLAGLFCVPTQNSAIVPDNTAMLEGVDIRSCRDTTDSAH